MVRPGLWFPLSLCVEVQGEMTSFGGRGTPESSHVTWTFIFLTHSRVFFMTACLNKGLCYQKNYSKILSFPQFFDSSQNPRLLWNFNYVFSLYILFQVEKKIVSKLCLGKNPWPFMLFWFILTSSRHVSWVPRIPMTFWSSGWRCGLQTSLDA